MMVKRIRKAHPGKRAIVTIETDRLGRLFFRLPPEFAVANRTSFKVKLIGRQAIFLRKPIRARDVMRINVERWKVMRRR